MPKTSRGRVTAGSRRACLMFRLWAMRWRTTWKLWSAVFPLHVAGTVSVLGPDAHIVNVLGLVAILPCGVQSALYEAAKQLSEWVGRRLAGISFHDDSLRPSQGSIGGHR